MALLHIGIIAAYGSSNLSERVLQRKHEFYVETLQKMSKGKIILPNPVRKIH